VLSEDPRVPDDVRGHMLADVADVVVEGKFKTSLAQARQALVLLEVEPERNAQDIAKVHGIIGRNLTILGDSSSAVALLQRTLPQDEALLGDRNEVVGLEWAFLNRALRERKRYVDAAAAIGSAQAIFGRIYGDDSNHVASLIDEAGDLYSAQGDYTRAEAAYRKVLNIYLKSLDPKHPSVLWVRSDLLGAIESSGRYMEALPQRLAMLEDLDVSADVDPFLKSTQYSYAGIDYRELGRFDDARSMLEQALALTTQSEGPHSAKGLSMRQDLGLVLQLQGLYAQSDAVFGEALALSLEHDSNTSFGACGLRHRIGQNLRLEHRYAKAVELLQALTSSACMPSEDDTDIWRPQILADLSQAQLDAGDAAGANTTADKAMGYARKGFSPPHYQLGIVLFAQARTRLAIGKPAEAEPLLREALVARSSVHPANDPRVLEVQVALVNALTAQQKTVEAQNLAVAIAPLLRASTHPYLADLRARLAKK
jgi:serine/threonine-protein kinase